MRPVDKAAVTAVILFLEEIILLPGIHIAVKERIIDAVANLREVQKFHNRLMESTHGKR